MPRQRLNENPEVIRLLSCRSTTFPLQNFDRLHENLAYPETFILVNTELSHRRSESWYMAIVTAFLCDCSVQDFRNKIAIVQLISIKRLI